MLALTSTQGRKGTLCFQDEWVLYQLKEGKLRPGAGSKGKTSFTGVVEGAEKEGRRRWYGTWQGRVG
jgi:hypothetical protein